MYPPVENNRRINFIYSSSLKWVCYIQETIPILPPALQNTFLWTAAKCYTCINYFYQTHLYLFSNNLSFIDVFCYQFGVTQPNRYISNYLLNFFDQTIRTCKYCAMRFTIVIRHRLLSVQVTKIFFYL